MKHILHLLHEAWHESHGQRAYAVAFTLVVYLLTSIQVKKLDPTLGAIFLFLIVFLALALHEIFTEMRKIFLKQEKKQKFSSQGNE